MPANPQTAPQPDLQPESKRFHCRHVRASGKRCGMAALRNEHFCYYHHATRRPAPKPNAPRYPDADRHPFALPAVEDRSSLLLALNFVLGRIASNDLDPKRAGLLLYGLQIAAISLPREPRPTASAAVCEYGHPCVPDSDTQPNQNPANDFQDDIALDPDLGPLAPVAEFHPPTPKDRPLSAIEQILQDMVREGIYCPRCDPAALLESTPPDTPTAAQPPKPQEDFPPFDLSTLPAIQAVADTQSPQSTARSSNSRRPTHQEIVILTLSGAEGEGPAVVFAPAFASDPPKPKHPGCPISGSLTA